MVIFEDNVPLTDWIALAKLGGQDINGSPYILVARPEANAPLCKAMKISNIIFDTTKRERVSFSPSTGKFYVHVELTPKSDPKPNRVLDELKLFIKKNFFEEDKK